MTDTVDALARVLTEEHAGLATIQPTDFLVTLAAEGLSIVKTAEWERAQRVEAAARRYTTLHDPEHADCNGRCAPVAARPETGKWCGQTVACPCWREGFHDGFESRPETGLREAAEAYRAHPTAANGRALDAALAARLTDGDG